MKQALSNVALNNLVADDLLGQKIYEWKMGEIQDNDEKYGKK